MKPERLNVTLVVEQLSRVALYSQEPCRKGSQLGLISHNKQYLQEGEKIIDAIKHSSNTGSELKYLQTRGKENG
jgi:hypothetical protein